MTDEVAVKPALLDRLAIKYDNMNPIWRFILTTIATSILILVTLGIVGGIAVAIILIFKWWSLLVIPVIILSACFAGSMESEHSEKKKKETQSAKLRTQSHRW